MTLQILKDKTAGVPIVGTGLAKGYYYVDDKGHVLHTIKRCGTQDIYCPLCEKIYKKTVFMRFRVCSDGGELKPYRRYSFTKEAKAERAKRKEEREHYRKLSQEAKWNYQLIRKTEKPWYTKYRMKQEKTP